MFFLDTSIFVYALLASEPLKKQRALELVEQALASHQGCTSYQVIQEFANVATRKFVQCFNSKQCKQFIDAAMQPLNRVAFSPNLLNAALDLQDHTRYSFFATAWSSLLRCTRGQRCFTPKTCNTTNCWTARCRW